MDVRAALQCFFSALSGRFTGKKLGLEIYSIQYKMSNSGGSSPFLESPGGSPDVGSTNGQSNRQIQALQFKLNTLQNEYEIEKLQLQKQTNILEKKYKATIDELEKALNDTKYLYESNDKLEQELKSLKERSANSMNDKDKCIEELRTTLQNKDLEMETLRQQYDSKLSKVTNQCDHFKLEAESSHSLLMKYEKEIKRQSVDIKDLQHQVMEKDDELSSVKASKMINSHPNYSTEEFNELTEMNKMIQDQVQYTKELELANMQQANELKKLKQSQDTSTFWKLENEKLQNKLSQLHLRLDNNNLKLLNDEMALERNQILDLNKNYENNIVNLKRLNHELEQQKSLSFEECRLLREQLDGLYSAQNNALLEVENSETHASNKNVNEDMNNLIDTYKNKTEDLTNELKKLNDQLLSNSNDVETQRKKRKLTSDQIGLNYSQRLNELQLENVSVSRELSKAQTTIQLLQEKLEKLTKLKEKKIRILQLRDGPFIKDQFIKKNKLRLLEKENADLLNELKKNNPAVETVPISVYDSLNFELKQFEQEVFKSNKRFSRLKQVFNNKSLEFIDVVNSLLGFKLEFQQDSRVKIFSCFKPEKYLIADLNENTLKSNLDADIEGWDDLMNLWVEDRGQLPCFLATITLRLWEQRQAK
ncbi:BDH_1b_G0019480.mRNA.1.CDS.1 [Saccharomyces cerevisiae]|nr:BDF_1d_G0019400.mRNA.1.CDS.1 [Saccharomyces cerevisiae]CAI4463602.1 CFS_G0019370.mRNA.1.CDS.1 [Saccharomyces cerevisiae]CAI4466556.1 BDH_1b_G0019480.mRNA.1.CDS.1 [Saccharomyces cerevisiae]CAI4466895.1 ABA_G0019760.mRNA.1.CDS.1 [Saccharomyces cerevisiae]CAI4467981.1 CRL_G0019390.mRNA.1.CDS.1 [Saccharomyces cerevisiae]